MSNFSIAYQFKAMTSQFQMGIKTMKRDMRGLMTQIEAENIAAKKMTRTLNDMGQGMTRNVTLPVAALGIAAVYSFAKLEKGLTNTINLLSDQEVVKWGGALKDAQQKAIGMGFSIEDVNKGLFDTVSALGASKNSMASFTEAQKLAIAGNTNLASSVNGITSIVNAYGRSTTSAKEVANALFAAQVKGKVTVEELSDNIGKVAPVAKQAGIGFKEALAGLSAMTLGGLSAEQATTALRATLQALLKPTKDSAKLLKKWGVPVGTSQLRAAGLSKTLRAVNIAMNKHSDAFANAFPNIRAFIGAATLSSDKLKILDDTVVKMNSDFKTGAGFQKGYNRMLKTASQQIAILRGQFTILLAQLGPQIFPTIKKVVDDGLIPMIKAFRALSPVSKQLIVNLALLAATVGPLMVISSKLIVAYRTLIPIFVGTGGALVTMNTGLGTSIALMGKLRFASLLVGAALVGWDIGGLIGQLKWVKDNITGPIAESIFGVAGKETQLAKTTRMVNTKLNLIKALKSAAATQGFKGSIAPIVSGVTSTEQAQTLIQRVATGKVNLGTFANQTPQQIQNRIIIETKDPQGVIKNVTPVVEEKPHSYLGRSMSTIERAFSF